MTRTMEARVTSCFGPAFAATLLLSACGAVSGAQGEPPARAEYLFTEILSHDANSVVIRAGVQVTGAPGRSYGVYFGIRHDRKTALTAAGGKEFLALAKNLVMPDRGKGRWSDLCLSIALADIEAAGVPKGKRTVLQVVCGVWDYAAAKYVGSGWSQRAPLILTADAAGRITQIESFNTSAPHLVANHPTQTIRAKVCELAARHLRPKTGLKVYRAFGTKNGPRDIFLLGDRQGDPRNARGHFFRTIDSPDKARELALLSFPGGRIIKTRAQYSAIAEAVKRLGWKPPRHLRAEDPPASGVTVTEEAGLGFRVAALMLDQFAGNAPAPGGVFYREFAITWDGRIGTKTTRYIRAPEPGVSAAPGWKQPLPAGPKAYRKAVEAVLKDSDMETIPEPIKVTDKTATIPRAEGAEGDGKRTVE